MNFLATATRRKENPKSFLIAVRSWRIWCALAIQDILMRYRGSVLGPFWITISTAITTLIMGWLYGVLFGIDRTTYLPYFTTGMIAWNFISMIINESTKIFSESKLYMENIQIPCMVYMFRLIVRNIIILMHNLPVFIAVSFIYQIETHLQIFLFIPGLLILCLNGLFYGTLIAFVSARFPDVGTIVLNLLQIVFFVSPIMWTPATLPNKYHICLTLNPFYYFVNLLRNPLLGIGYSMEELMAMGVITLIGGILFISALRVYSKRVIFWL